MRAMSRKCLHAQDTAQKDHQCTDCQKLPRRDIAFFILDQIFNRFFDTGKNCFAHFVHSVTFVQIP